MRLPKLLEKEIRIRLTDLGFIETTCYLGIPTTSLAWDVSESESSCDAVTYERLMSDLEPVRRRPDRGRPD